MDTTTSSRYGYGLWFVSNIFQALNSTLVPQKEARHSAIPAITKKQGEDRKERWHAELVVMEREERVETVALCASICH